MARRWKTIRKAFATRVRHQRLRWRRVLDSVDLPVELVGGPKGWPVCTELIDERSVVYSFGVGRNVDWDLAMIRRFGVTVHAFDPTPESIRWVRSQALSEKFAFHACGISDRDGLQAFHAPKRASGYYTTEKRRRGGADVAPVQGEVRRLSSLMREMGHRRIDVLKLDVEGSEFAAIPDLVREGIEIGQLLVEVHYHHRAHSFREGMELIETLKRYGMRCFYVSERGLEFGFVQAGLRAEDGPGAPRAAAVAGRLSPSDAVPGHPAGPA